MGHEKRSRNKINMIAVVQRVSHASVTIDSLVKGEIAKGLLVLMGVENADTEEDIAWLSAKITGLRIFNDSAGVMNVSVKDDGGDILLVSQFTLHASTKKGNRPSYIKAAKPEIAIPVYEKFILTLEGDLGKKIQTGEFGADMKVTLTNDGPVTIIIDTKNRV
jgi:D-aminoacyl-tRNA deacylase